MVTISLCMIVKDEQDNIERCLSSISDVVDEIIIVDTGSKDQTKAIASNFTDKIFDFTWVDDFSVARNFSFQQATMDYILWLDADDIFLPEDAAKLKRLKNAMTGKLDVVMMKYNTCFDQNGNVTFSYFRERLLKKSCGYKWKEPVHEYIEIFGAIINSDICVTHTGHKTTANPRNLKIYEQQLSTGKKLSQRGVYYYARELKDNNLYADAIKYFSLFLYSDGGWVEDKITACGELARCYLAENQPEKALESLMFSFTFDTPRAEICCQIGYYFKFKKNYKQAVFWFELIFILEKPINSWGFRQEDCWGFIPCIECAACYNNLGNSEKASFYMEKANDYKK